MPPLLEMPELLRQLFDGTHQLSKEFRQNIRAYNSLLSFASCGAKFDESLLAEGRGIFTYKIHGEMYHLMGSLLPTNASNPPKFLQLYFYDTEHEADNRLSLMSNRNRELIQSLQQMIRNVNPWINLFKNALEVVRPSQIQTISFKINAEGQDPRTYNRPTSSDVAAIIPGENFDADSRDVVIKGRDNQLQRINELHRAYDPFSYVLLFPHGEFGWSPQILRRGPNTNNRQRKVTQLDYYSYRIHFRPGLYTLHRSGRLFLQFVVDVYARIEQNRLAYIRFNQSNLRTHAYQGFVDAINTNTDDLSNIGRTVFLPSTFYNSPRFLAQQYQDAMAMVRELGKPDLFITFTCNSKWKEIVENLLPNQNPNDRPDLIARVFHQKLKEFINDIVKKSILGRIIGYCYTIEFQKRGTILDILTFSSVTKI